MNTHLGKEYTCGFCKRAFHAYDSYYQHTKRLHFFTRVGIFYKCTVCGEVHPTLEQFSQHVEVHRGKSAIIPDEWACGLENPRNS